MLNLIYWILEANKTRWDVILFSVNMKIEARTGVFYSQKIKQRISFIIECLGQIK